MNIHLQILNDDSNELWGQDRSPSCPSTLRLFETGEYKGRGLPLPERLESVERHARSCPVCCSTLEGALWSVRRELLNDKSVAPPAPSFSRMNEGAFPISVPVTTVVPSTQSLVVPSILRTGVDQSPVSSNIKYECDIHLGLEHLSASREEITKDRFLFCAGNILVVVADCSNEVASNVIFRISSRGVFERDQKGTPPVANDGYYEQKLEDGGHVPVFWRQTSSKIDDIVLEILIPNRSSELNQMATDSLDATARLYRLSSAIWEKLGIQAVAVVRHPADFSKSP